jgi:uncharacterized delta-60 repeat protein
MKAFYFLYIFSLFLWSALSHAQPGLLDPGFGGGDGLVTSSFFPDYHAQGNCVVVQEDGKILVSGNTWLPFGNDFAFLNRYLPDGSPDESFNGSGGFLFQEWNIYTASHSVAVQPDGRIVCVLKRVDSEETVALIYRFHPDGSPDTSFGTGGVVTKSFGTPYLGAGSLTLQPDGKMVIGGYLRFDNDTFSQTFICRFMPDGTPDSSFNGDGAVVNRIGESYAVYSCILIQEDGRIIAAGYADYNQYDDFIAVRYNPDGTLDQTFSGDGVASAAFSNHDDSGFDAILQPDGKIVIGGTTYNMVTGKYEFAAARFNSDGTADNSFHNDGKLTVAVTGFSDGAHSILLQPDGKIVLGGYAHSAIAGGADMALVRLNANGTPDFTFSGDGIAIYEDDINTSSGIEALALQPDGKIVGTGSSRTNEIKSVCVARFLSGITVSANEVHLPELVLSLYPNPIIDQFFLSYQLDRSETITMYLSDIEGKFVQNLMAPAERSAGKHYEQFVLNSPLTPGIYFVNITSGSWITAVKVVVE